MVGCPDLSLLEALRLIRCWSLLFPFAADWIRLATDISLNYAQFDGFLLLHGTDTMSFTASALSFLLEDLGKPVIVTGAQIPLSQLRNDAYENVLGGLIVAGTFPTLPEVGLFFAGRVFRGNRTVKGSNDSFEAFRSEGSPPWLVKVGIGLEVDWGAVRRCRSIKPFRAHRSAPLLHISFRPTNHSLTVSTLALAQTYLSAMIPDRQACAPTSVSDPPFLLDRPLSEDGSDLVCPFRPRSAPSYSHPSHLPWHQCRLFSLLLRSRRRPAAQGRRSRDLWRGQRARVAWCVRRHLRLDAVSFASWPQS
jgi:hypothetical protein